MHLSISLWDFLATVCYIIIFGFLANTVKAMYPDSTVVKALMFVTS